MKIAILGGSFDPPHLGHLLIARQVIEHVGVDQVWLMPMYNTFSHHAIFQKELSPGVDRMNMTKLLETDKIKVSDFEMIHNQASITIVTLEKLAQEYPNDEFYWITGSDKLATFQKYDRWQDIVSHHNLIIFPREHMLWHLTDRCKEAFDLQTIPENIVVLDHKNLVLTNVSSTLIRQRVKDGLSIRYLVPEIVEKYINAHKLYK